MALKIKKRGVEKWVCNYFRIASDAMFVASMRTRISWKSSDLLLTFLLQRPLCGTRRYVNPLKLFRREQFIRCPEADVLVYLNTQIPQVLSRNIRLSSSEDTHSSIRLQPYVSQYLSRCVFLSHSPELVASALDSPAAKRVTKLRYWGYADQNQGNRRMGCISMRLQQEGH